MALESLVDNTRTDKNTLHSYLPVYESLFAPKRQTAKHVLEIGIAQGGSIKLWRDYFPTATIHAVDIYSESELPSDVNELQNVSWYPNTDAYSPDFLRKLPNPLDVVIDDGPHTLQSQKECIAMYLPNLAKGGLLVIEDIATLDWIPELRAAIPSECPCQVTVYDLRDRKQRHDDILLILQKM